MGMRDTELYFHLLGLVKPWTVGTVELSVPESACRCRGRASGGTFVALSAVYL